jgi:hypothetical protein
MHMPGFRSMQSNLIVGAEIFTLFVVIECGIKQIRSSAVVLIDILNYDSAFFD